MVCRNADRGKQARDEIAEKVGGNLPDACRFFLGSNKDLSSY